MEYDLINTLYVLSVEFIIFYIYKIPMGYYIVILGYLAKVKLSMCGIAAFCDSSNNKINKY